MHYNITHIDANKAIYTDLHGTLYTNPETNELFFLAIKNDANKERTYRPVKAEDQGTIDYRPKEPNN